VDETTPTNETATPANETATPTAGNETTIGETGTQSAPSSPGDDTVATSVRWIDGTGADGVDTRNDFTGDEDVAFDVVRE
jgi:hypothetical protein